MENKEYKPNMKYTEEINEFVVNEIKECSNVLDVGCWTGANGKFLIDNRRCSVDGIDFSQESLMMAKKNGYNNIFNLNLNCEYNLDSVKDESYDYIILADVIEHLIDPGKLLICLMGKLKKDGSIVVSTPNIAFLLYRMTHLFGMWNYSEYGVMDRTHLKFFTKKTVQKLVSGSGYKIEFIRGYNIVKDRFFFLRFLGSLFPELFAIQFLVKIKR